MRTILGQCPTCRDALLDDRPIRSCGRCHGQWIPEDLLRERIASMTPATPRRLEWRPVVRDVPLACAICRETMAAMHVFGIPFDRCHMHGIWFAKDQLSHVLLRSAEPLPKPPRERDSFDPGDMAAVVAVDLAANVVVETIASGAGTVVVEAAMGGVGEVAIEATGGVFEAIVDVIAGLF
ncbi:MAG: hypothetical protein ABI867_13320 [Kofleriaceae bacterium]